LDQNAKWKNLKYILPSKNKNKFHRYPRISPMNISLIYTNIKKRYQRQIKGRRFRSKDNK